MKVVTPAMNANLPDGPGLQGWDNPTHRVGRAQNVLGELLSAPWIAPGQFLPTSPNYGCVNAPEYRAIAFKFADFLLAEGGDAIQHDDPAMNGEVVSWGGGNLTTSGCYCDHCMKKFTKALNFTKLQRSHFGIDDSSWNYREWLLNRTNISAPHEAPDTSVLRASFVDFQQRSTEDYLRALRDHLYTGTKGRGDPNVTLSANNGALWTSPYNLFDYGMSELELNNASPNRLYNLFVSGVPAGKQQVLTMPKSANASYWYSAEGTTTIRAAIAMSYALGSNMFTPWDIYLPVPVATYNDKTGRYYGNPGDYADLFSFVRGVAQDMLEEGADLAKPLPIALCANRWSTDCPSQPSKPNYRLAYMGYNGSAMGERYRFVGEHCPECHSAGSLIPGKKFSAMTLIECEAGCDAVLKVNVSACLGVYYDGTFCSVLPMLVVTKTGMRGVSYLRIGSSSTLPPSPRNGSKGEELVVSSDPAVLILGRTAAIVGDAAPRRLLLHAVDTRGLPGVPTPTAKSARLQVSLSNRLARHNDTCPTVLREYSPGGPVVGVTLSMIGCSVSAGNKASATSFEVAMPTPWSMVLVEW
jgi:hypothetical protein